jgi:aromatic-L-amino-acid/L-tryptophan decarboxylase
MDETGFKPIGLSGYRGDSFLSGLDAVAKWALEYLDSLEDRDVSQEITPGEILSKLPEEPPLEGVGPGGWDQLLGDVESIVEPGLVHWQSPRFFAYFPCSASMAGMMGELVSSVLNVNGMLWSTSPSATEIEMRMMDWCAALFGLPDQFRFDRASSTGGGCIQGTASEAALAALVAARRRMVDQGRDRTTVTLYTSTQAHSSIVKAAMVAGLADNPEDHSRVRLIPADGQLRMDPRALMDAIRCDIDAGLTPCFVSTTQGTTSTGACDPLEEIGEKLAGMRESQRPWLHVDAAWAGAAAVCPEHRAMLAGVEHADSLCINPHKWLLTNFDCDLFWVRDRRALTDSMSITPAYLHNAPSEDGGVIDYRDWHVPLGRRMRAIKLWFVIRHFGVEGLRAHIRHHIELAKLFEAFVGSDPRLELAFERVLGLVCFRVVGGGEADDQTRRLIERVNGRRRVMISQTVVPLMDGAGETRDGVIARVAVGSTGVDRRHIEELIREIGTVLDKGVE